MKRVQFRDDSRVEPSAVLPLSFVAQLGYESTTLTARASLPGQGRATRFVVSSLLGALVAIAAAGCGDERRAPGEGENAPLGSTLPAAVAAAEPSPSSATGAASASPTAQDGSAGVWGGTYTSKKADIALEPGVRVGEWKKDDGAVGSGAGKLELRIEPDGGVSGSLEGPLGPGKLRGAHADGVVTATLAPSDPTSAGSFEGTLWGRVEGSELRFVVSAATADAAIARRAEGTLGRRD